MIKERIEHYAMYVQAIYIRTYDGTPPAENEDDDDDDDDEDGCDDGDNFNRVVDDDDDDDDDAGANAVIVLAGAAVAAAETDDVDDEVSRRSSRGASFCPSRQTAVVGCTPPPLCLVSGLGHNTLSSFGVMTVPCTRGECMCSIRLLV